MGALIATTGALVAEIAPPGKKNLCSAISYCGVPLGSLLGSLPRHRSAGLHRLARPVPDRGAAAGDAVAVGALSSCPSRCRGWSPRVRSTRRGPSPSEPVCRCRTACRSRRRPKRWVSPACSAAPSGSRRSSLGLMSALAQGLNYFLNTWLPVLMEQAGFNAKGSLAFLLVLSGGAIVGALAGSRFADRFGPKPVVAICFLIGGVFISLMTLELPLAVRLRLRRRRRPRHHRNVAADLRVGGEPVPHQDARCCCRVGRGLRPTGRGQRPAAGRVRAGRRPLGGLHLLHPDRPGRRRRRPDVAGATRPPRGRPVIPPHRTECAGRYVCGIVNAVARPLSPSGVGTAGARRRQECPRGRTTDPTGRRARQVPGGRHLPRPE